MTVPATDPRPATPPSDDVVLETIARLHSETGELPGRDAAETAAGIGSTRAGRLIGEYASAHGIERPARGRGHLRPVSAQAEQAGESGRGSVSAQAPNTGEAGRTEALAQAGGDADQGKSVSPDQPAHMGEAGESGRGSVSAQAPNTGEAGRTEALAQADRAGESGRGSVSAQAGQPRELAQWSGMLRGALARRLESPPAREAQPEADAAPISRAARARQAVVLWGPLWLVFGAAFLATWAGGVTLAERVGWTEVVMFPGWS